MVRIRVILRTLRHFRCTGPTTNDPFTAAAVVAVLTVEFVVVGGRQRVRHAVCGLFFIVVIFVEVAGLLLGRRSCRMLAAAIIVVATTSTAHPEGQHQTNRTRDYESKPEYRRVGELEHSDGWL